MCSIIIDEYLSADMSYYSIGENGYIFRADENLGFFIFYAFTEGSSLVNSGLWMLRIKTQRLRQRN